MTSLACEVWDRGRVRVNRDFAALFTRLGLTTFEAFDRIQPARVEKDLRQERVTSRIELADGPATHAFYIKRHRPPPLKEYLKPLWRGRWPQIGARHEWEALLAFHAAGIPTMTPAAIGEAGRESWLLTAALDGCVKLSHWMRERSAAEGADAGPVIDQVAGLARTMHAAGLHHQDFYLGHLLLPETGRPVHVIDLGRARSFRWLGRHWIVKDLAQLDYSASELTRTDRLRFLRTYLGRPLARTDRGLVRAILAKKAAIARHSSKNRL